jgi:hypothetical protein
VEEDARMKRMPAKRVKARRRVWIRDVDASVAGKARRCVSHRVNNWGRCVLGM